MPEGLFRLLYCSRNRMTGNPDEIAAEINALLEVSRLNNRRDHVTGALLFSAGCFTQVLEGKQDVIERTFERIQLDPRHTGTTILDLSPLPRREFGSWSMAYRGELDDMSDAVASALDRALLEPLSGSAPVLAIMHGLMQREGEWA